MRVWSVRCVRDGVALEERGVSRPRLDGRSALFVQVQAQNTSSIAVTLPNTYESRQANTSKVTHCEWYTTWFTFQSPPIQKNNKDFGSSQCHGWIPIKPDRCNRPRWWEAVTGGVKPKTAEIQQCRILHLSCSQLCVIKHSCVIAWSILCNKLKG